MPTKNVLITGVYGLIGSTTYLRLRERPDRYDLYGLDRSRELSERVTKGVVFDECCINAPDEIRFEIFYGMSHSRWHWVDAESARQKVGYVPQDRAEDDPEASRG